MGTEAGGCGAVGLFEGGVGGLVAWIESHTVLNRHRKVIDLAVALNIKPVQALGHLHAFWHTALEQQENGNIRNWSDGFLASAADFEGDPAAFRAALENTHWVDNGLIHDWLEYAGKWLISKYSTSNRKRLVVIWKEHGLRYGRRDNKSIHRLELKRTESEQKANLPNLTIPNLTIPNQPKDKDRSRKVFSKPSPQQVSEYALTIGFVLDGEHFVDYYEARDWKIKGTPIKSWEACVRTWKKNGFENGAGAKQTPSMKKIDDLAAIP